MRTKHLIVFLFPTLIFSHCKKDDEVIKDTPLLIGVKSDNINIVNTDSIVENISIDLNSDNVLDVKLWTEKMTAPSGHSYSSGITLLDSTFQLAITSDSISPEIINYNDTISRILRWSSISQKKTKTFILVKDSYMWTIGSHYTYSYWINKNGFMCLRKEDEKGMFKYGWIKIEVDSYFSYKVFEYAFMK